MKLEEALVSAHAALKQAKETLEPHYIPEGHEGCDSDENMDLIETILFIRQAMNYLEKLQ